MTKLLSVEADAKTAKGTAVGYLTGALFMTPESFTYGGGRTTNVCPFATEECRRTCIYETGMGSQPNVRTARERRRMLFDDYRASDYAWIHEFRVQLYLELDALQRKAAKRGLRVAVRLNATSDIAWERVLPEVFEDHPDIQFYDYTKWPAISRSLLPANYHITFSWRDDMSEDEQREILACGGTLAVPFAPDPGTWTLLARSYSPAVADREMAKLPSKYLSAPVVNGDEHDLIFLHPPGSVIGLRFKGKGGSRPSFKPGMFAVAY